MTTIKSLESTCLVSDRDIKKYSFSLSSMDLLQSNSNKEDHHEEPAVPGSSILAHHCHNHSKAHEHRKREQHQAKYKLCAALVICLIFVIAEIIGGQIAGSLAVFMDAAHVLVDLMSFLISIFSLWLSSKSPSKRLTYGWHRAEILGTFLSIIIIWVLAGVLTYLAIMRLLHSRYEIDAMVMLITSGCAVIANIILILTLHQAGSGKFHRTQPTTDQSSGLEPKLTSANTGVRAAFVHAVGDLSPSISVLISALIIFFKPEYKMADPICTFVFAIYVLGTTITILRDIFQVLMEGTPKGFSYDSVKERILVMDKVKNVHNLHLWSLTMTQHVISAHIVTVDTVDKQQTLKDITAALFDIYGFHTVTLQIEPEADQKPNCVFCQDPRD